MLAALPYLAAALFGGAVKGRAQAAHKEAEAARKDEATQDKNFLALAERMVKEPDAVEFFQLPSTQQRLSRLYGGPENAQAFLKQALGNRLQQTAGASLQAAMQQFLGLTPQPEQPGAPAPNGAVGVPTASPAVPTAPAFAPSNQLPMVREQIKSIDAIPLADRGSFMDTRERLVGRESELTDALVQAREQPKPSTDLTMSPSGTIEGGPATAPPLPPFLRSGLGSFTIPKDASGLGIELRGTADEMRQHYVEVYKKSGMTSTQIVQAFRDQRVRPPDSLQRDAVNERINKFYNTPEFHQNPRLVLDSLREDFPDTDPKLLKDVGNEMFSTSYLAAKQRLRATGMYHSEAQLAQAAFNETAGAMGSQFVPQGVLQDVQQSRSSSVDGLMVELLDKALGGDVNAMGKYTTLLQLGAGKIGAEQAARTLAEITTKQRNEFVPPEQLKSLERGGQSLPFGTTPQQAAQGATIIKPETQAARTDLTQMNTKMNFAAERSLPVFDTALPRMTALLDKASSAGFVGKSAAVMGVPTALGQEIKKFDEFREKFAGNLRALSGETAGVITDKDIARIVSVFPSGDDFVKLFVNRDEQIIRNLSEVQTILSDRLGRKVTVFDPLIQRLKQIPDKSTVDHTLKQFEDAIKGVGQGQ